MKHSTKDRPTMFRQGDVIVIAVAALPANVKAKARDNGRVVLAYGEVTGHSHSITESDVVHFDASDPESAAQQLLASVGLTVEVGRENAPTFLDVPSGAELRHEEHGVIALEPGRYVVLRQREFSDADEPITVAD